MASAGKLGTGRPYALSAIEAGVGWVDGGCCSQSAHSDTQRATQCNSEHECACRVGRWSTADFCTLQQIDGSQDSAPRICPPAAAAGSAMADCRFLRQKHRPPPDFFCVVGKTFAKIEIFPPTMGSAGREYRRGGKTLAVGTLRTTDLTAVTVARALNQNSHSPAPEPRLLSPSHSSYHTHHDDISVCRSLRSRGSRPLAHPPHARRHQSSSRPPHRV